MSTYPGSLDNGATDTEYTIDPDRRISAQEKKFNDINEAIGKLEYGLEQHIAQCADGLAPLADFIAASWAVLDEYEARLAKLEAEARPIMDETGVLVSHDAWDAMERELDTLRAFKASVPWDSLRELSGWPCERPYLIADEWIGRNAPNTSSGYIYITVERDKYRREQAELAALRAKWESVPWEEIGHSLSTAVYGLPLRRDETEVAIRWWHGNAPQESAE